MPSLESPVTIRKMTEIASNCNNKFYLTLRNSLLECLVVGLECLVVGFERLVIGLECLVVGLEYLVSTQF